MLSEKYHCTTFRASILRLPIIHFKHISYVVADPSFLISHYPICIQEHQETERIPSWTKMVAIYRQRTSN
ncbi:unnamed protein product [Callosobruchus maculatus]|uniref:Uncharacterized protein n=1 Tax=Callosobruchus maculatus TaxID=64391 RepID=A0A653DV31_CALMS|nr:unnamed protein product [Callosobruchus maculatus]